MSQFANWLTSEIMNTASNYSHLEQKIDQLQYEVNKLKAMIANMEVQTTSIDLQLTDKHGRAVSLDSYHTEHEVYVTCSGPGADAVTPHADEIDSTPKRATRSGRSNQSSSQQPPMSVVAAAPASASPSPSSSPVSMNSKRKRTEFSTLKIGDRLSETQYYQVLQIDDKKVKVRNERGFEFAVSSDIIEEGMYNASQYSETKKVSRTAIVNILESAGDTIFTVSFHKKPDEASVMDVLKNCTIADFNDAHKLRKISSDISNGEARTLVGYLVSTEPKMGRSMVVDLTKPSGQNSRLVDHRTLNWMIFKGVKYEVK